MNIAATIFVNELRTAISHLYHLIREQRNAHLITTKTALSLLEAMRSVPGFEDRYAQEWASLSQKLDGPHHSAMQKLEQLERRFADQ